MNNNVFLDDFLYVCNAFEGHPLLLDSYKKEKFMEFCSEFKKTVIDYDSLIEALTQVTMFFQDGHTNIELPYTIEDLCLRIPCKWLEERLVLYDSYLDIPAGAEIVSVEELPVPKLFSFAETRIPHENTFLVKSRMIEYPYKNYHVFSEMNLVKLFGKKKEYTIKFWVNDEILEKQCPLEKYNGFLEFSQKPFISWEIKENSLILHLRECICSEEYKDTLRRVARLCKEKNLHSLELDLSENMGGTSEVIDEFIRFTHTDAFRRYEMIDFSSGNPVCIASRKQVVMNIKQDILFPKKIFCRVSNTTFSSARTFAVTLKDNGIATIIGEPTGGKPCSYGMPKRDVTPNFNIHFRVSRALFLRPDVELEEEDALVPDEKEV